MDQPGLRPIACGDDRVVQDILPVFQPPDGCGFEVVPHAHMPVDVLHRPSFGLDIQIEIVALDPLILTCQITGTSTGEVTS